MQSAPKRLRDSTILFGIIGLAAGIGLDGKIQIS